MGFFQPAIQEIDVNSIPELKPFEVDFIHWIPTSAEARNDWSLSSENWYRGVYKEHVIWNVHVVGRSLCYDSETCNLQHNNTKLPTQELSVLELPRRHSPIQTSFAENLVSEVCQNYGKQCCAVHGGLPSIRLHCSCDLLYLATRNEVQLQLQFYSSGPLFCPVVRFLMCMLLLLEKSVSVQKFHSLHRLNRTNVKYNNSTITQIQH
jgi:hypothetical protein